MKVGVYGFIFYRDAGWIEVIIDDMLYTTTSEFDLLLSNGRSGLQKAFPGNQILYFAKSGIEGETWVPLLEKAYAKFLGSYSEMNSGVSADAMGDLTGGISNSIQVQDLSDPDQFWRDELIRVNEDRLFRCFIHELPFDQTGVTINGLYAGYAYSVTNTMEVNGKRFLRIHNQWGRKRWRGAWSDASKEWTPEWVACLPELHHTFGNQDAFIMEYSDFLETWTTVECTRWFPPDSSWRMSSLWLDVQSSGTPSGWNVGDVSFTFNVDKNTSTVIALSQLDDRHFSAISTASQWAVEFEVYRLDLDMMCNKDPCSHSDPTCSWQRTVSTGISNLQAGEYIVHVRLDPIHSQNQNFMLDNFWCDRTLSKIWSRACVANVISSNFNPNNYGVLLPAPTSLFGGKDLTTMEIEIFEHLQQVSRTHVASITRGQVTSDKTQPNAQTEPKPTDGQERAGPSQGQVISPKKKTVPVIQDPDIGENEKDEVGRSGILGAKISAKGAKDKLAGQELSKGHPPPEASSPAKAKSGQVKRAQRRCNACNKANARLYHLLFAPHYYMCEDCAGDDRRFLVPCSQESASSTHKLHESAEGESSYITIGLRLYTNGGAARIQGRLRQHGRAE